MFFLLENQSLFYLHLRILDVKKMHNSDYELCILLSFIDSDQGFMRVPRETVVLTVLTVLHVLPVLCVLTVLMGVARGVAYPSQAVSAVAQSLTKNGPER